MAKKNKRRGKQKKQQRRQAAEAMSPPVSSSSPQSGQPNRRNVQTAPGQQPARTTETTDGSRPIKDYYIRLEGLNIDSGVLDTNQISVVRGAGLLLRQAAKDAAQTIANQPGSSVISTGASIGEFRVGTNDATQVAGLISDIQQQVSSGDYAHLDFAVVAEPIYQEQPASVVRERALARIRFEQMRMPTLVPPPPNRHPGIGACGWEGRRPADALEPIQRRKPDGTLEEPIQVSQSVYDRYRYGRKQKHLFYLEETGIQDDEGKYTNDLAEIAELESIRNLNGKIAVIYADGNRFSAIRDQACQGFGDLKRFDEQVQGDRRRFLFELLERIAQDPAFNTQQGKRRIETLLWGGDELILVVPAWRGLQVLQHFFAATAKARFQGKNKHRDKGKKTAPPAPWPLTYAAGIVFCRARTPIKRAQGLARDLADGVKSWLHDRATATSPDQALRGQLQNAWDYAVLESVDFPTEDELGDYFADRYRGAASLRRPLAPFANWCDDAGRGLDREEMAHLLESLSKGQVYAVARQAIGAGIDWTDAASLTRFNDVYQRMREVVGSRQFDPLCERIQTLFGSGGDGHRKAAENAILDPWPWIHLAELWDYLAPEPDAKQEDES
ncbi:MAG: hypothetical protein N838_14935 [Thiohalocapsa sp. PB-PSB1]|jgi:hypothetical protein|nr:MAG: hypothetical protein N838_14935 [Thiohalocapsa sp. PB-PSB1]